MGSRLFEASQGRKEGFCRLKEEREREREREKRSPVKAEEAAEAGAGLPVFAAIQVLRLALKTLSDAEKQLQVAADRGIWLTAALLPFAPDWSLVSFKLNTTQRQTCAEPTPSCPLYPH